MDPPLEVADQVTSHPLISWAEATFGLDQLDDQLVRKRPISFADGVGQLSAASGLDAEFCESKLRAAIDAASRVRLESGEPVFAFRIHQFLSSGLAYLRPLEIRTSVSSPPKPNSMHREKAKSGKSYFPCPLP